MSDKRIPSQPLRKGDSLDVSLDHAIEAMNQLRADLRTEGLTDLADTLDDTLVKCLTLYAERESPQADEAHPEQSNGSGDKSK